MKKLLLLLFCVPALANIGPFPGGSSGGGGSPGGVQYSVQTNNGAGGFTGDANFLYDGTTVAVKSSKKLTSDIATSGEFIIFNHNAVAADRPSIGLAAGDDRWMQFNAPYSNGAMEFHLGGHNVFELKVDQVVSSYPHIFSGGTAVAPGILFSNSNPSRGIYYDGTNVLVTVNGAVGGWDSNGYSSASGKNIQIPGSADKIIWNHNGTTANQPFISTLSTDMRMIISAPASGGDGLIYMKASGGYGAGGSTFIVDTPFAFQGADVTFLDVDVRPVNTGVGNLGSASKRWLNVYTASFIDSTQIATPATPASGNDAMYFKSDDKLYRKNSAGTETLIGPSTGGGNMIGPGTSLAGQLTYFSGTDGLTTAASTIVATNDSIAIKDTGHINFNGGSTAFITNLSTADVIVIEGTSVRIHGNAGGTSYANFVNSEMQMTQSIMADGTGETGQDIGARGVNTSLEPFRGIYGLNHLAKRDGGYFGFHDDSTTAGNFAYGMLMPSTTSLALEAAGANIVTISNAGLITFGASGGTQIHAINGNTASNTNCGAVATECWKVTFDGNTRYIPMY